MAGGMSAECPEPGPGGAKGQSPGPGRQCPPPITPAPWSLPRWRAYVAAAVLCYINLLNYMNWFIIAGVLLDVQEVFQISDSHAGLLQTVFIGCLLLSAPVFGYLGDRYSRKTTMSFGILLWSGAGLSSSFISPRWSGLRAGVGCDDADWELALGPPNPPRGAAETQREGAAGGSRSSWCEDVRYLGKNLIFGSLTIMTGVIGVILGAEAARRYKKVIPRAEPLICASSLLATAPCLYLALVLAPTTLLASYVFLGLGELLLSCNWAVVADILLSVVVPRCRGTAEALQITVGHILGDAGSPYLTGLISSVLRARRPDSYLQRFLSLQQSFLCCTFVIALGGGCFLLTALYLERDEARAWQPGTGTPDSKDVDSNDLERQGLLSGTAASTEEP
ncbi:protein spinster homolog 3 isoform X7 [Macaca fascicularis]|uniref:protein spinster homolog 3 isoform X7 n=1 Tax=Macaca fascicularis TaxID=9541 RepID=UPI003D15870A